MTGPMDIFAHKRNGMRVIAVQPPGAWGTCEVITNAYGNGYINPKPGRFTEEEWGHIVKKAKKLEAAQ